VDPRLRFYIACLLRAERDWVGAAAWLDSDDMGDAFFRRYYGEYGAQDRFYAQGGAFLQTRFFEAVHGSPALKDNAQMLHVQFYSSLLQDAAENEQRVAAEEPGEADEDWDEAALGDQFGVFPAPPPPPLPTFAPTRVPTVHSLPGTRPRSSARSRPAPRAASNPPRRPALLPCCPAALSCCPLLLPPRPPL
jgi:hypothetical protein